MQWADASTRPSLAETRKILIPEGFPDKVLFPKGFPDEVLFPKGYEDLQRPSTTPKIERRHSLPGVGVINLRQLLRDLPTHTFMAGAPWGDHRGSSHYPMAAARRLVLCNTGARSGGRRRLARLLWGSGFGKVDAFCGWEDFNWKGAAFNEMLRNASGNKSELNNCYSRICIADG